MLFRIIVVAPHPELISTLSCEATLCGSQGLIRALQAAWPRLGFLKASGRAGASPLPAKLWFFLSIVSFLCVAVRCSPPASRPAMPCCSATPSLLSRLFCKPGIKRKRRWCDTPNLLFRLAKSPWAGAGQQQQRPWWQCQLRSSSTAPSAPASGMFWNIYWSLIQTIFKFLTNLKGLLLCQVISSVPVGCRAWNWHHILLWVTMRWGEGGCKALLTWNPPQGHLALVREGGQ